MEIAFKVAGMVGGFSYRLGEDHLRVHFHWRMYAEGGERFRVTPDGWSRVERSRVPPPPR